MTNRLRTDAMRTFGGKKYMYLTWVSHKSGVKWFKDKAKLNKVLLRVTKQTKSGLPSGGYNIWIWRPGS